MHILIKQDNFSTDHYELQIGEQALEFRGKDDAFALPYSAVNDFCITQDSHNRTYFTMLSGGRMHEGQILEPKEIEPFIEALKKMLDGVISVEVRSN